MTAMILVADADVVDAIMRDVHFGRPQEVHEGGVWLLQLDRQCDAAATVTNRAEIVTATLPMLKKRGERQDAFVEGR